MPDVLGAVRMTALKAKLSVTQIQIRTAIKTTYIAVPVPVLLLPPTPQNLEPLQSPTPLPPPAAQGATTSRPVPPAILPPITA